MKERIYGEKISISTEHAREFWNMRAESVASKGLGIIMCGDQAPDVRVQSNMFDRDYIIPHIGITDSMRVLDVGCGVGRMAKMILPRCGFYCGTDFSAEMIKVAERECAGIPGVRENQYSLYPLSFGETVEKDSDFYGGRFDVLIASGVCPYINDSGLEQIIKRIPDLMCEHSVIYFQHPVGLETRLTLDHFYSEAMDAQYSAIYRTVDEYLELYSSLIDSGFTITEQGYKPRNKVRYSDTDRWYAFLRR